MLDVNWTILSVWTLFVIGALHLMDDVLPKISQRFHAFTMGRRRYIIKNVFKSGLISYLAYSGCKTMIDFFVYNKNNNTDIHTLGLMYAIPDVYAIWWLGHCCPGYMAKSTVYHHISVGVLSVISLLHDFQIETHWNAILVYAYMSTLTGIVNFYLGIRFILNRENAYEDKIRSNIAKLSLKIYLLAFGLNWYYQLRTLVLWFDFRFRQLSLPLLCGLLLYCIILVMIIKDDLELMTNLHLASTPYVKPAGLNECIKHFVSTLTENIHTEQDEECAIVTICRDNQASISCSSRMTLDIKQLGEKIKIYHTPYTVHAHDVQQYTLNL
jgi:hypothetical protein